MSDVMHAVQEIERAVLRVLVKTRCANPDGYVMSFAPICEETGLSREYARTACRALAEQGLAFYAAGLWTEDGHPAGSGYGATIDGHLALAREREERRMVSEAAV